MVAAPFDIGPAGRMAVFADPEGAHFRVWQPGATAGAQLVNAPGSWNWSDLETRDIEAAKAFYGAVFGWEFSEVDLGQGPNAMIRVPGYGDHLESLTPGTLESHKSMGAPEGFSDAVGWMQPPARADGAARWAVTFSVADVDATAARASELGGTVLVAPFDVPYVRMAVLRDPAGETFGDRPVPAAGRLNRACARRARPAVRVAAARGWARRVRGADATGRWARERRVAQSLVVKSDARVACGRRRRSRTRAACTAG